MVAVLIASEPRGEGAVDCNVDDIIGGNDDGGGGGRDQYVDLLLFLSKSEFLTLIWSSKFGFKGLL